MYSSIKRFLILLILIYGINLKNPTPLSTCTKGRISSYTEWGTGGSCGFGPHNSAEGSTYLYPSAPNSQFFNSAAQCGICYEIVGPYGVIRTRVEDSCSTNDDLGYCNGDMYHFKVANPGASFLMKEGNVANVTFRMISCDYSNKIKIKTNNNVDGYYYSFIVLDHNLGVSYTRINEDGTNAWVLMTRETNNYWTYSSTTELKLPLKIRIYSINGDFVTAKIDTIEPEKVYDADNNFEIPTNTYFDISKFSKVGIPSGQKSCCERDKTDFTPIYSNGIMNGGYENLIQKLTVDFKSNDKYEDKLSMNVKFQSLGKLVIKSLYPIKADQYTGVTIILKASTTCDNCLQIRAYDLTNKIPISLQSGSWRSFTFDFSTLGIENNEFNGLIIQNLRTSGEDVELNIGSIVLDENPYGPDAGLCLSLDGDSEQIPNVIYDDDGGEKNGTEKNGTEIPETEINGENNNGTSPINDGRVLVNIISIEKGSEAQLINIKCYEFEQIEDEKMTLFFRSDIVEFETSSCILSRNDNKIISSFTCQMPAFLPNGVFSIYTPTDSAYNAVYPKKIYIENNQIVSFDYTEVKPTELPTNKIEISKSISQNINPNDKITFEINPIQSDKFNIENNEIIFTNYIQDKYLYLKNCQGASNNNIISSFTCTVSQNVMEGEYITLEGDQNVSIQNGISVKLKSETSVGGFFDANYIKTIRNDNSTTKLTFDVLYYDSNIKPKDIFPYTIFLKGNKFNNLRHLAQNSYNTQMELNDCTAGDYSKIEQNAIGSIKCTLPTYVPAGLYTKLESNGFDVNPNKIVEVSVLQDYYRSEDAVGGGSGSKGGSSSSSKLWIVWVILGLLVAIAVVITIVCCFRKKKEDTGNRDDTNSNHSDSKSDVKSNDDNKSNISSEN
jgi:expansin (peptidoglycan-binding protein)